ncbi:MAG TPA: hypothetical protein VM029_22370, partial [Opitutaceae bacterium]|nr:hypothetical protein [Opitutaceae bacterium]
DFTVAGRTHPAGSYVVKTNQAFRPHVLDMFESQDHPNDFKFEGGPPNRPYDVAGWTLAFQMGIKFDRVLEAFDGPFERLPYGELQKPPAGRIAGRGAGFVISHRVNDSFVLANRLLKAGAEAYWLKSPVSEVAAFGTGALYVPDRGGARGIVEKAASELGLDVRAVASAPGGEKLRLAAPRIALWDRYGGSIPSGWTRWVLEQFEFPFDVIFPQQIDAGRLRDKYDVIVFVTGAIAAPGARGTSIARPKNLPAQYETWIGRLTPEKSVPALKEFLQAGGSVVTIGSSSSLAYHLGLPVKNALRERGVDGKERNLPDEKFYIPGSVLEAKLDPAEPVTWGMPERSYFYFERSPAFVLTGDTVNGTTKPIAWFDTDTPLRSGWAWGQKYLKDTTTVATAQVGKGRLYLMGSEVAFRGQTHGTFKLLFNALLLSAAKNEK